MDGTSPRRERVALGVLAGALVALAFAQAPGAVVPETKLEVFADPGRFLGRALAAWDPSAGFGRVQNQAVGYLFPMGAFAWLGELLGVPVWVVQRAWIALVLVVGLWGAHRVARLVGVATPTGRLVAATAYALAPATLGLVAFQSAGQLPYALAPLVLVPLLGARDGDDPRRVAARSALWVVAMGGVNGASALAVLPLPILWLATRRAGPDRRRLAAWWGLGVVLATLWWLVPLLVTVRYGIRFTDYTELADTTTFTQSATEVLRGTGNWLGYLQTSAGPWLPGSWALATHRVAIAASVLAAAAGLGGLARRDAPERAWLGLCVLLGVGAIGAGYAGDGGGWFAEPVRWLLDGPLVPFRNVHKLAAVVRLPLALGLGHLVAALAVARRAPATAPDRRPAWARAGAAVALAVVVVAVVPAAGELTAPGEFDEVPAAWSQAAGWLDDQPGDGRALLVPGSAFAEYRWGRPLDEPMAVLAERPWAVRDLIPLGGHGSTRLLDGLDRSLATDAVPPGFAAALARAGVAHLVVRNDLDLARTGGPAPATLRRLLADADGLERVAGFGPEVAAGLEDGRLDPTIPGEPVHQLEVYAVDGATPPVVAYPEAGALVTGGGPEGLLAMPPELLAGRATVAADAAPDDLADPVLVATDSARRRDVRFGQVRDAQSWTLRDDEASPLTGDAPQDRWQDDRAPALTVAELAGVAGLAEGVAPEVRRRPEHRPAAAFDGDPTTAWMVPADAEDRWVELAFDRPRPIGRIAVAATPTTGIAPSALRVVTDGQDRTVEVPDGGVVELDLGSMPTERLRLEVAEVTGDGGSGFVGIAEVTGDAIAVATPLVVPDPGGGSGADVVVLARDRTDRFSVERRDEEAALDRSFTWAGGPAHLAGTATAAPGPALDAALAALGGPAPVDLVATATSTFRDEPGVGPGAALDGDPATAWVSGTDDREPALELRWDGPVAVDGLRLVPGGRGTEPIGPVEVAIGGRTVTAVPDPSGRITFPATAGEELRVAFPDADDFDDLRPVGIAELEVPALVGRPVRALDPAAALSSACGDGPPVAVDGEPVPTRVEGTVGDVVAARALRWEACAPLALHAGEHRLQAAKGALVADTAVLTPVAGVPDAPAGRTVDVERWGAEERTVAVGPGDAAIVATTENANDGWQATLDGEPLAAVEVDGWRQGWRVPAGEGGTIALRYRPGTTQRAGLALGLVALAALVVAALLRPRRRGSWSPVGPGSVAPWVVLAVGTAAAVALGGWAGLVVAPALVWARRRPGEVAVAAAGLLVAAGVVALTGEPGTPGTGTFSAPAQLLAAAAVAVLAAALAGRPVDDAEADAGR